MFSAEALRELFARLGYSFEHDTISRNVANYSPRTNPELPQHMERLDMPIRYRGHSLDLRLTRNTLTVRERNRGPAPIRPGFKDEVYEFAAGGTRVFDVGEQA